MQLRASFETKALLAGKWRNDWNQTTKCNHEKLKYGKLTIVSVFSIFTCQNWTKYFKLYLKKLNDLRVFGCKNKIKIKQQTQLIH